jgi:hypothetical protein
MIEAGDSFTGRGHRPRLGLSHAQKPGVHFLGVRVPKRNGSALSGRSQRPDVCCGPKTTLSVLHNSLTTLGIARSWLTRAHLASFSASSLARLRFEARRRRR